MKALKQILNESLKIDFEQKYEAKQVLKYMSRV